jgi:hypothetical protein
MQKTFGIESSHLNYHLEGLGNLLLKTEDGKYALSSLGEAAVSMMYHVEEPPKHPLRLPFPYKRWKFLVVALLVGFILLSASFYFEYEGLSQLSTQYSRLVKEHELLQEVLREALHLGNASVTHKYKMDDTIASSLFTNGTFDDPVLVTYWTLWNLSMTYINVTSPWGPNIAIYSIYSLANNSTLEMEISFLNPDQPQLYLSAAIWKDIMETSAYDAPAIECTPPSALTVLNYTEPWGNWTGDVAFGTCKITAAYRLIWEMKVTNSTTCLVTLPSRGRYEIRIEAPRVENTTDHYKIDYTITIQVKDQRGYTPFFVKSWTESTSYSYVAYNIKDWTWPIWSPHHDDP